MKVRCALYILTKEYNYKVITRCDPILPKYYITMRRKIWIQGDIQVWTVQKKPTSYKKETREPFRGPERKEPRTVYHWSTTLPQRNSDQ